VIKSFADRRTEAVYKGSRQQGLPPDIAARSLRKLRILNRAGSVSDLRIPPGNRLEKLSGNRAGQWSIRVNEQWRICFAWGEDNNAYDVEICDYH
jgi:proteic killer suppression protein